MEWQARVRAVLAADCAGDESWLRGGGVHVVKAAIRPGRRRFPWRDPSLLAVTMGEGAVVSVSGGRLAWARDRLAGLDRDELFSARTLADMADLVRTEGQTLAGPQIGWVCTGAPIPGDGVQGLHLHLYDGAQITELYGHKGFPHALGRGPGGPRPDVLACAATGSGGAVAAIAGASADCDDLWQIGVDVLPEWRGRGLGRAVVAQLASAVRARGRLPYYSTAVSNLASAGLAAAAGFRPCWVQVHAVDGKAGEPA